MINKTFVFTVDATVDETGIEKLTERGILALQDVVNDIGALNAVMVDDADAEVGHVQTA